MAENLKFTSIAPEEGRELRKLAASRPRGARGFARHRRDGRLESSGNANRDARLLTATVPPDGAV